MGERGKEPRPKGAPCVNQKQTRRASKRGDQGNYQIRRNQEKDEQCNPTSTSTRNKNSFFKQAAGMQIDSTRKHTLTAINNLGFKQFCITIVGTTIFRDIATPITIAEKCVGAGKTLRECLLEQESVVEGNKLKLFTGIEKDQHRILKIGV